MIFIENRRKSRKTLEKLYPKALLLDVTSRAENDMKKLSPFYPHGGIPIPYSENAYAESVEGIWQGLKVFENHGIDQESFRNRTMRNIKRTVRKYGKPLGHQKGINNSELLDYVSARIEIYLPAYLWVLENKAVRIVAKLREYCKANDVVLLDYATNGDILDPRKPLSHAYLVKVFVEGTYPTREELEGKKKKIADSGINPYKEKKKPIKVQVSSLPLDKVMEFLETGPKTSKQIISKLGLEVKSRSFTRMMKKAGKFDVVAKNPIKFANRKNPQGSLFD